MDQTDRKPWLIDRWVCSDLAQARISFATFVVPGPAGKAIKYFNYELELPLQCGVWVCGSVCYEYIRGAIKKEEFSTKRRTTASFRMQRSFLANLCEFALYIHNGRTHYQKHYLWAYLSFLWKEIDHVWLCVWLVHKIDVNSGAVNDSKSKQKINISLIDFCEHLIGLLGSGSDLPVSVWFMVVSTTTN